MPIIACLCSLCARLNGLTVAFRQHVQVCMMSVSIILMGVNYKTFKRVVAQKKAYLGGRESFSQ